MSFSKNIKNGSFWNVGFCNYTPEELIDKKGLPNIQWVKHPYKDRFFADPFILKVTDSEIVVFVEEYVFDNPPGLIVELVIDRETKELKQRFEMLRLPSHLSYPAIIRKGDEILVYPENGASGKLNVYRYDAVTHKLVDPCTIHEEAIYDATIHQKADGSCIMVATKQPDILENAYLFGAPSYNGPYTQIGDTPFQPDRSCARMAGNFFEAYGQLYRPAQDCVSRYGSGTAIMQFDAITKKEQKLFTLRPQSYKFNLGLHTINFFEGLCVIDGYGYLYPTLGRIYASKAVEKLRDFAKSKTWKRNGSLL